MIEFQKRGLPHCHMLLIAEEDKIRTPEDVDRIVCAEIPDSVAHPRLYGIVSKMMIHGPCGVHNADAPCMDEHGFCTKKFPKKLVESTVLQNQGYPEYRRRSIPGRTVTKPRVITPLDSTWVVPYNCYLSQKYNCHINVEICSSVKSFKYIYKYIYKG